MTHLKHLSLLLATTRYLKAAQIWHRAKRTIKRRWWQVEGKRAPHPSRWELANYPPLLPGLSQLRPSGPWASELSTTLEKARAVSERHFCFLNRCVGLDERFGWHDESLSHLWRYHLHYFDYVRDLMVWAAMGERATAYRSFRELSRSWIVSNQELTGDGWHPYTISLRVVNWLHAVQFFEDELKSDGESHRLLLNSLYGQTQVLFSDLELDVRGNHLLENLRALICVGSAFVGSEPQHWCERGLHLLQTEVVEQVLADGGHFERSPGYHLVVLKDFLEIAIWLHRFRGATPRWVDDAIRLMLDYLWMILTPNGQVPMLKDTALDAAPKPEDMLAAGAVYFDEPAYKHQDGFGLYPLLLFGNAGWEAFQSWPINDAERQSVALSASGHYVLRDKGAGQYFILDAGKPCPDYLPAHAQADLLTYELFDGNRRIVVDSGIYEYTTGAWRDYFRSTRAHNTVEVEAENQSEVWSNFRVGRRARPGPIFWQETGDYILVQGEHDGYRRLPVPVIHQRTVLWWKKDFWLIVDQMWGRGWTGASNHIHLHPDLGFEVEDESHWRITKADEPLWLIGFGHQSHLIVKGQMEPTRQGWYSERFGQIRANYVLTLHKRDALPFCFGYAIAHAQAEIQCVEIAGGHQVNIGFGRAHQTLCLPRNDAPRLA